MRSGTTKEEFVEILYFSHFFKHFEFIEFEQGFKKKVLKDHISVSVVIPLVCGDKSEYKDPEEIKREIFRLSQDFEGDMQDVQIISELGISRSSFYKYKKQIKKS